MKKALKEYLKDYHDYSGLLSSSNRQLAFAGIAIVWIFRVSDNTAPLIPTQLIIPLLCFSLSLFFELIQYLLGTLIWKSFFKSKEVLYRLGKLKDTEDITAPSSYQKIISTFFYLKIAATIIGYIFIIIYLIPLLVL